MKTQAQANEQQYGKIWNDQKAQLQKRGCQFFNLEKTRDEYKNGVVTYQNIKCEYWTASIVKGILTDVMIKATTIEEARENQYRWQGYLN